MRNPCPVYDFSPDSPQFVYLAVRDYCGIDMDGLIGIPLDELVEDVIKELFTDDERKNTIKAVSNMPSM